MAQETPACWIPSFTDSRTNPFDANQKEGKPKTLKWCIWEVLKDHPEGLKVTEVIELIISRDLYEPLRRAKNASGQVTAEMSKDSNFAKQGGGVWVVRPYNPAPASDKRQAAGSAPVASAAAGQSPESAASGGPSEAGTIEVGMRVSAWWEGEGKYFDGRIEKVANEEQGIWKVRYSDGSDEWMQPIKPPQFVGLGRHRTVVVDEYKLYVWDRERQLLVEDTNEGVDPAKLKEKAAAAATAAGGEPSASPPTLPPGIGTARAAKPPLAGSKRRAGFHPTLSPTATPLESPSPPAEGATVGAAFGAATTGSSKRPRRSGGRGRPPAAVSQQQTPSQVPALGSAAPSKGRSGIRTKSTARASSAGIWAGSPEASDSMDDEVPIMEMASLSRQHTLNRTSSATPSALTASATAAVGKATPQSGPTAQKHKKASASSPSNEELAVNLPTNEKAGLVSTRCSGIPATSPEGLVAAAAATAATSSTPAAAARQHEQQPVPEQSPRGSQPEAVAKPPASTDVSDDDDDDEAPVWRAGGGLPRTSLGTMVQQQSAGGHGSKAEPGPAEAGPEGRHGSEAGKRGGQQEREGRLQSKAAKGMAGVGWGRQQQHKRGHPEGRQDEGNGHNAPSARAPQKRRREESMHVGHSETATSSMKQAQHAEKLQQLQNRRGGAPIIFDGLSPAGPVSPSSVAAAAAIATKRPGVSPAPPTHPLPKATAVAPKFAFEAVPTTLLAGKPSTQQQYPAAAAAQQHPPSHVLSRGVRRTGPDPGKATCKLPHAALQPRHDDRAKPIHEHEEQAKQEVSEMQEVPPTKAIDAQQAWQDSSGGPNWQAGSIDGHASRAVEAAAELHSAEEPSLLPPGICIKLCVREPQHPQQCQEDALGLLEGFSKQLEGVTSEHLPSAGVHSEAAPTEVTAAAHQVFEAQEANEGKGEHVGSQAAPMAVSAAAGNATSGSRRGRSGDECEGGGGQQLGEASRLIEEQVHQHRGQRNTQGDGEPAIARAAEAAVAEVEAIKRALPLRAATEHALQQHQQEKQRQHTSVGAAHEPHPQGAAEGMQLQSEGVFVSAPVAGSESHQQYERRPEQQQHIAPSQQPPPVLKTPHHARQQQQQQQQVAKLVHSQKPPPHPQHSQQHSVQQAHVENQPASTRQQQQQHAGYHGDRGPTSRPSAAMSRGDEQNTQQKVAARSMDAAPAAKSPKQSGNKGESGGMEGRAGGEGVGVSEAAAAPSGGAAFRIPKRELPQRPHLAQQEARKPVRVASGSTAGTAAGARAGGAAQQQQQHHQRPASAGAQHGKHGVAQQAAVTAQHRGGAGGKELATRLLDRSLGYLARRGSELEWPKGGPPSIPSPTSTAAKQEDQHAQQALQRAVKERYKLWPAKTLLPDVPPDTFPSDVVTCGRILVTSNATLSQCLERMVFISNHPWDIQNLGRSTMLLVHNFDEKLVYGCFQCVESGEGLDDSFGSSYKYHVRVQRLADFEPIPDTLLEIYIPRKLHPETKERMKFFEKNFDQRIAREVWQAFTHYDKKGRFVSSPFY